MTDRDIFLKAVNRAELAHGREVSSDEIITYLEKEIDKRDDEIKRLKAYIDGVNERSAAEFTEEKTGAATGEILINKAEFDAAMKKVAEDMTNDPKIEGMAKMILPLSEMTFAAKMADILGGLNNGYSRIYPGAKRHG